MATLVQTPEPGQSCVRFVGDTVRFELRAEGQPRPPGWRAFLRTNLGRAAALRAETIAAVETGRLPTLVSWRDIALPEVGDGWALDLPLVEVGYFRAKAYAVDPRGWQHWAHGPDFGVNVQPNWCRTGNILYCAFTRMFGAGKTRHTTLDVELEARLKALDDQGYTVIPPSGRFRDLLRELPHIFEVLGCRILHLLPVNPTPTTRARFGRFGSPYATQDLLAIDPALVEFDRRTTGVDQFRELTEAVHLRGGRVFLDVVLNHTGWGSTLQETRPDWFLRQADGTFISPGAWGTIWEDLIELEHDHAGLRRQLGEVLVEWCRRGVDGFRCDAGYMIPMPVWQYLTARVRQEFPDTVFFLEGLGGAWEATQSLLQEGGLQWAYSELFQNYSGAQIAHYLDHALAASERSGLLVHYSETHDNDRLATRGKGWSLLRNRLCALTSGSGGFGFTCGVEWLAREKIDVHSNRGLAWGSAESMVPELARLNRLLAWHPCFFDGARCQRLSEASAPVYALGRTSATGQDTVLVLVNTDPDHARSLRLSGTAVANVGPNPAEWVDLLGEPLPPVVPDHGNYVFALAPGAACCLAPSERPKGMAGDEYRRSRARQALALSILAHHRPIERLGQFDPHTLGQRLDQDPAGFLATVARFNPDDATDGSADGWPKAIDGYPQVVGWRPGDERRVTLVPPQHWVLIEMPHRFRAALQVQGEPHARQAESVAAGGRHIACFAPRDHAASARLELVPLARGTSRLHATFQFLDAEPKTPPSPSRPPANAVALLTNGLGGMARLRVSLGSVASKYDCALAANLHPHVPVDRHVFAKRIRVWANADGFLSPLDAACLLSFAAGPPAQWRFLAPAGDGRGVELEVTANMRPGRNTTQFRFRRPAQPSPDARPLPAQADVRLTVRVDLEDRNFHWETHRNPGAEHHFDLHCQGLRMPEINGAETGQAGRSTPPVEAQTSDGGPWVGFRFAPESRRTLRVWTDAGVYHPQAEWCERLPHPVEGSRGQTAEGDAYSPGWFELPLQPGAIVTLTLCAEPAGAEPAPASTAAEPAPNADLTGKPARPEESPIALAMDFESRLRRALRNFVVRREEGRTVIAGYPWFLDWGRDTLICARGLIAAGALDEVQQMLRVFGRLERDGTLPNSIHGEDASNRDTSDAPLWYGVACEECAAALNASEAITSGATAAGGAAFYQSAVAPESRSVADVLRSIAVGYLRGTPNGIRVDLASGLVFSPSHFTWMDTNHPAGTPREGYPVEIQTLWIRLLRQLDRLGAPPHAESWSALAQRATASFETLFWLEDRGYYADALLATPGQPAAAATVDTALRSNALWVVALGLAPQTRARRCVTAALQYLVVPGALRSLAPRSVSPPLPIRAPDGRLLNDPHHPYWGRYEGDEDTRRKPAYHNGTAWTWTFPTFCEALVKAWNDSPAAIQAARAYLGSACLLLDEGCLGHLPEVLDGDAPHAQRGCDAQAWAVTETLRVWRWLEQLNAAS